jgi:hypothetical protein
VRHEPKKLNSRHFTHQKMGRDNPDPSLIINGSRIAKPSARALGTDDGPVLTAGKKRKPVLDDSDSDLDDDISTSTSAGIPTTKEKWPKSKKSKTVPENNDGQSSRVKKCFVGWLTVTS